MLSLQKYSYKGIHLQGNSRKGLLTSTGFWQLQDHKTELGKNLRSLASKKFGSGTSGTWNLNIHLTVEKSSTWHLVLANAGDLQSKRLGREVADIEVDCLLPQDARSRLHTLTKHEALPFFPLLWHWPTSPAPKPLLKGIIFQSAVLVKNSSPSMTLVTRWSTSLSLVNNRKHWEMCDQVLRKERDTRDNQNKTTCVVYRPLKFSWPPWLSPF